MDVYKTFNRIGRYTSLLTFVILLLSSVASAQAQNIGVVLNTLCTQILAFLAVAMVLMILLAAVVYAVGQVMGAETRARATVWATAMFTGAIMAAVIYVITPFVINTLTGGVGGRNVSAGACPAGV